MILEAPRLRLRRFTLDDAPLVLALLNDPGWLRYIGERNVRSLDDARGYLEAKILASYAAHGFGLWLVERKDDGAALGMCGLVKRDTLPGPDLGFAFLARHRGRGYAEEAAAATVRYARRELGMARLLAITTPGNERSARLLARLGFERDPHFPREGNPADPVEAWVLPRGGANGGDGLAE